MIRSYISLAAILLFSSVAKAQQPVRLSLQDCIDYALKNNYTIKNARLDVLIQEAQVKQTTAAALPHVNGKADFTDFIVTQKSFIDASTFSFPGQPEVPKGTIVPLAFSIPYAASAGFTASQVLFDGSVLVALQARKAVMELATRNEQVTEQTTRYNVYKAYNALVIAYKQYDIVKSSLGFARSMERELELTRQGGFAEKIDVDRTSVQVNNLATDSMRIGNILTLSEQMLKYQMGMDINTPITLTDTSLEKTQSEVMALVGEQQNYERVPEYALLTASKTANEYNLKRYRLSALPSVSGFWSYGTNYGSDKFVRMFENGRHWEAYSTVGLSLNLPIFNGFMRTNQVREAKLNIEKAQNNIDNLKLGIDFQAASARTTLKNSLLQAQSQRRNLDLSNSVLDLAQKKYKAGVGSNLEVTTAQTDLLRAQNNYFSALLDIVNAEADLRKALGLLK